MRKFNALVLIVATLFLTSCFEDNDDIAISGKDLNNFVWTGLNSYYLYKENVPNLADDRFSGNAEFSNYLNNFSSPVDLFESLKFQPESVDRFSRIFSDYVALEQQFQGISLTSGMEYGLFAAPNSATEGFGVIRLVLPNSPADNNGLKRGDIFYGIDGIKITRENFASLINQDAFTLNLGFYNTNGSLNTSDDSIDPLNQDITITKTQYTEDPIFKTEILSVGGENVGYLMYNGFISGSENELNTVFGEFKSNNVQHLVIDLRYNPGGSVRTTTFLASMITGQYNGELFEKLVYNNNQQSQNTDYNYTNTLTSGASISSLGLDKLYVLTTDNSASASEGLINGLKPYLNEVIQIGTNTVGKTQASRFIYDSPNDFSRQGVNPQHTYVMLPLVANGVNKNDIAVPSSGLPPSIGFEYEENPLLYGILGNINEPMLALALADIQNSTGKALEIKSKQSFKLIMDSSELTPFEGGMIID